MGSVAATIVHRLGAFLVVFDPVPASFPHFLPLQNAEGDSAGNFSPSAPPAVSAPVSSNIGIRGECAELMYRATIVDGTPDSVFLERDVHRDAHVRWETQPENVQESRNKSISMYSIFFARLITRYVLVNPNSKDYNSALGSCRTNVISSLPVPVEISELPYHRCYQTNLYACFLPKGFKVYHRQGPRGCAATHISGGCRRPWKRREAEESQVKNF